MTPINDTHVHLGICTEWLKQVNITKKGSTLAFARSDVWNDQHHCSTTHKKSLCESTALFNNQNLATRSWSTH